MPRSHVRILIYRTWAIPSARVSRINMGVGVNFGAQSLIEEQDNVPDTGIS